MFTYHTITELTLCIQLYCSSIRQKHLHPHIDHDDQWNTEGETSRRLRQRHDAVNHCMDNSRHSVHSEQQRSPGGSRARRQIQRTEHPKRWNVLQIVEMRASDPLNRLIIKLHFPLQSLRVFWIGEYSFGYARTRCQNCHKQNFESQYRRVHNVRLNGWVI